MKNEKYRNLIIIISLLLINVITKSIYLTDYNIDFDEPFSLFYSQQSLREFFPIFKWENNPPLFFVILHFWIKLFGVGVFYVRLLPMLFSSLAVVFIYKIGKKYLNQVIAIGASLLYTFSKISILEAHDVRVYSLLVFLSAASMYYYFSLIDSEKKNKYLVSLTIINILLIYAHFLAFFIISLELFYSLFISSVRKRIFKKHLISAAILFLSYLPYLYFFLSRFTHAIQTGIYTPQTEVSYLYTSFIIAFCNNLLTGNIFLLSLIIFVIFMVLNHLKFSIYEKMILGWFFFLYLLVFFVSFKISIITFPKYLIFIAPGFFLSLMIAVDYLTKNKKNLGTIATLIYVLLMILSTNLSYSHGYNSKEALSIIQKHKSDSTLVFIAPRWVDIVFTYHYDINAFKDYLHYTKYLNDRNIFILSTSKDINMSRLSIATDVLLIDGWNSISLSDPKNTILRTLINKFEAIDTIASNSMVNEDPHKMIINALACKFETWNLNLFEDSSNSYAKINGSINKVTKLKGYAIFHFGSRH